MRQLSQAQFIRLLVSAGLCNSLVWADPNQLWEKRQERYSTDTVHPVGATEMIGDNTSAAKLSLALSTRSSNPMTAEDANTEDAYRAAAYYVNWVAEVPCLFR